MSPVNLPQLPTDGGYINTALFDTEPGIPFIDDTQSLYEQETADPYKETAPFSASPISQGDTTFDLPKTVAQPREEGALERYMRAQREEEEAKRQEEATQKSAFDLANRDYLQRRSVFDQSPLEMAVEIQAVSKAKKEAFNRSFQKDFGWLNGQEHPDWPEYISENYPNWKELTPSQKDDVFEHWRDNETKYYVGYSNVNPETFQEKFSKKWFDDPENQEIVNNKILIAQEKLKTVPSLSILFTRDFGYEAGESIDSSFYKMNKAGLMAARGFESMTKMAESVNEIQKRTGVKILNEDGTINIERVKQARQNYNAQIEELKKVDAYNPETDDLSANFENLVGYTNTIDPNKKWNDVKTAVKALNEIQSLLNIKEKKFNESIQNADGFFETTWNFLSQPETSARFFGGQFAAQIIDTLPETIGAGMAGGPVVGYLASGFIGGAQEERLVAKELITEAMVKNGYNPDNIADWQTAYEEKGDIIENAKEAASKKGYATTPVENALELIFAAALKGVKFSGRIPKIKKGLSYLTGGGVAAAAGEVSGQMSAYGKVDTGEVAGEVIGNIFGLAGPATFNAAGKIWQKVFGKKTETETTQTPTVRRTAMIEGKETELPPNITDDDLIKMGIDPASVRITKVSPAPTAETTTKQKTQEEILLEKEQARKNVKATGTTQEGTGPITPATQENVTEENVGAGPVAGAGRQAVASPPQQSAAVIESALNAEEELRQSEQGASILKTQLETEQGGLTFQEQQQASLIRNLSPEERSTLIQNNIRKAFPNVQELIGKIEEYTDSDEKANVDVDVADIQALIDAINQLEPEKTETAPTTETKPAPQIQPQEFSNAFRQENASLPEKAQAAWTPEAYAAVDNFFATGNEESLAGLNKIQQNRAKAHYYGTIEESEAKANGMRVEQWAKRKQRQGGFLDIPALGNGVKEAAVTAWTKAKNFASWSAEMLENFGNRITPYLRDLWNRLNSLIRNTADIILDPYLPNARARERGSIDARQSKAPISQRLTPEQRAEIGRIDAEYADAYARGDTATGQRMVDEAAKAAGFILKLLWHGSNRKFNQFKKKEKSNDWSISTGEAFHFSNKKNEAEQYSNFNPARRFYIKGPLAEVSVKYNKEKNNYLRKLILKGDDGNANFEVFSKEFRSNDTPSDRIYPNIEYINIPTKELLKGFGVKGMFFNWGEDNTEYAIFDSENIKSADPFTYDDQGKLIPLSQRFNQASNDIRNSLPNLKAGQEISEYNIEGNPDLGENQQRASLIRKVKAFFGGALPANVTFLNDRSEGNRFVARINTTLTGQADIQINYAFADDTNIDSALNEEIGHFASNRGFLTDFYNSLTPTEKADVDEAVAMYGGSEARMADTSVASLQAEERLAKSFAAIASRNKDLWARIKNLINKILAKLGIAPANTDNQVADIFLKAMNAYKNQRENRPDFSNRRISSDKKTSFYSKPTARQEIDKAMDKIKESKDSPVRSLFNSINLSSLSTAKRNELQDRMKAYADATKAVVRGTEILNPQDSKQRFDELIQYLSDFKKTAWEDQFKKLQKKYPSSLDDKTADKFTSAKAVTAYVANLNNKDSKKIIKAQQEKAAKKLEATERKDEQEGAQITLAIEAQSNINKILDTDFYKKLPTDNKLWTLEAMEYLETLDPTQQTQRQNEALVAAINSAIEGNIIGFGKYTAARRIQKFLSDLNAYIKANGGKIPWYTAAETRRIRKTVEGIVSSKSLFFKKETVERMIFSHPELRKMWVNNLGDYLEKVQTANSSLQNELDKRLQATFEKHGLKDKTFAGNVKDRQLFSDKARKSKARMMVAAMITQWTDGSNDPIAEINKAIDDILMGINNEITYSDFGKARATSNLDSFNSVINPLIRDGFLIRNGEKFEVQATPEVWSQAVLNALQENERDALIEIRNTASLLQNNLKFTKEFWYGEEFEPVVNYVPKQAYNTSSETKEEPAPELNEGSSSQFPTNPSLRRQGSVLFARQGLGEGQYYSLDIERAATKAIKSAAYEVTTAPERIIMHEALNNNDLLPYFGNEKLSRESRRNTMRETLKAIHKAEMHLGTSSKAATSREGVVAEKIADMLIGFIGAQMLGKVKNIFSQYLAPIAGSTVIAGKDIFNGMVQITTNEEWQANDKAAIKALYAIGFPDLEHRSEIIDFFYDVSSNTDLVKDIAKISLDENLTEEQRKDVIIAKVLATMDAGVMVPKYISQMVNTKPDAFAAKHVFPGLLINRLKEAGVINKADEFLPSVINDPRTADALSKAKKDMSTTFGNANRYSLRPEFFVDKSKWANNFLRNTLFSISQTATSMAGDTIVAAKDISYFNSADKYASEIRKEGAKRLGSIALQTYIFAFISKVMTLKILQFGALLFGKAEGLDDEEEKNLRNRIAINQELAMQDISQRAISDMIANTMGFAGTNSIGKFASNTVSKYTIEKLLYSDYEEKKKELENKIKQTKNPSKKADFQFQLELIKKGKQKINNSLDDPDLGPTVESFVNTLRSIDDPSQSDFDAFAEEYYNRGGIEKKPERNLAVRYLGEVVGLAVPDIGSARKEVYKARKEIAEKRKSRLESKEQKGKKKIEKINIPLISYP